MSACEKCWADAYVIARTSPDSQVEAYRKLLAERDEAGHPCTDIEQHGGWMAER